MESSCSLFQLAAAVRMMMMMMVMRRRKKMAAVSTVSLLLLLCCSFVSCSGSQPACDVRTAIGHGATLPLSGELATDDMLKWMYGGIVLVHKRLQVFLTGSEKDIEQNGNLKLLNVQENQAGKYKAEVYSRAGQQRFNRSVHLCVLNKVPKPQVTASCSGDHVVLTCTVPQAAGLSFTWLQDKNPLKSEKGQTLKLPPEKAAAGSIKCRVSNGVNEETSPNAPACKKDSTPSAEGSDGSQTLFGLELWIMATILGVGGGLVLVLIITTIVCCTRAKRKRSHRVKEEEELRLEWTNQQQQQHQHNHPHHHHHHHQDVHQQPGHTGPRQHRCKPSRDPQHPRGPNATRTNPRNPRPNPSPRPPAQHGAKAADHGDGEQAPPLPQPRKKHPRTPRV